MLQVLSYLRANGFTIFIVSGGGVEFMRVFAQRTYGIPPEHVIGSTIAELEMRGVQPVLVRLPKVDFIDDGARLSAFAFGNSDGDLQMLEWTTPAGDRDSSAWCTTRTRSGSGRTTGARPSGRWTRLLDESRARSWIVVDMKAEWKRVFKGE
jgi:hypothetical protein